MKLLKFLFVFCHVAILLQTCSGCEIIEGELELVSIGIALDVQLVAQMLNADDVVQHSVVVLREVKHVKYGSFMVPGRQLHVQADLTEQDELAQRARRVETVLARRGRR